MRNSGIRFTPSDVRKYPLPDQEKFSALTLASQNYFDERAEYMTRRNVGLTATYNNVHNPDASSAEIQTLRDLHASMDHAVALAYGWDDLQLGHGFHTTKQGIRFTVSDGTRREILQRLLRLNHERYADEVEEGLHPRRKK